MSDEDTRWRVRMDVTLSAETRAKARIAAAAWLECNGAVIQGVGGCDGTLEVEETTNDGQAD